MAESTGTASELRRPAQATMTSGRPLRTSGGRPLRRRQSLPTGRAVVGGFLVALSAVGIFFAWSSATAAPTERYVVARHDLTMGSRIGRGDLMLVTMDLPDSLARSGAFSDPAKLAGATVVGPIRRGELVQAGSVLRREGGAGELEVSFAIDPSRALAGNLVSGEQVDVLATFGTGVDSYTAVVVSGARVLSTASKGGALGDRSSETITLAVKNRQEALALSHAVNAGEVTLVRTGGQDGQSEKADGGVYRAPASRPAASSNDEG